MTYEQQQDILERNRYQGEHAIYGNMVNAGFLMPMIDNFTASGLSKTYSFNAQLSVLSEGLAQGYGNRHAFGSQFFGNPLTKLFHRGGLEHSKTGPLSYITPNSKLNPMYKDLQELVERTDNLVQKTYGFNVSNDMMNTGWGIALSKESSSIQAIRALAGQSNSQGTENELLYNFFNKSSSINLTAGDEEMKLAKETRSKYHEMSKKARKLQDLEQDIFSDSKEAAKLTKQAKDEANALKAKSEELFKKAEKLRNESINDKAFNRENLFSDSIDFIKKNFKENEAITIQRMDDFYTAVGIQNKSTADKFIKNLADAIDKDIGSHTSIEAVERVSEPNIIKEIKRVINSSIDSEIAAKTKVLEGLEEGSQKFNEIKYVIDSLKAKKETVSKITGINKKIFTEGVESVEKEFSEQLATNLTNKSLGEKIFSNKVMRILTGTAGGTVGTVLNIAGAVVGTVASIRQENAIRNYVETALSRETTELPALYNNDSSQHSLEKHFLHSQSNLEQLSKIYQNKNTANELRDEISPYYDSILNNYEFGGIQDFETS
ncbi:hypothetical protein [Fusobacterium necrophorum]|uniref:Uncharacterized protein n=1 Tax=Fusobacterium necrophorum subsp. funduliforme TaxID=143387 RepID=A0A162J884_9FUSO|nr:hypothetical protein [Fusobacterium necrophorum]KYL05319.1 hypothetical protein A2J07_00860 [Fusobacterium necrophorum subsp. funduliforme]